MISKIYNKYLSAKGITTDSRKVSNGEIYFALKGEHFNGNDFAEKALEKGASFVVVDEKKVVKDERYILVEDVLETLQNLAQHHRRQFEIPILAITGTNGKTTTKELIAEVLETTYIVHFTQGNFNNHIGVPLTLLAMKENTEIAVIEMGANHPFEIEFLCKIAEPTHGLVTNVGKAHLEGFGGFNGVIKTKGEMYDYIAQNKGVAFVNKGEDHLTKMALNCNKKIEYGNDKYIKYQTANPFLKVNWKTSDSNMLINTNLVGSYNFNNVQTAISIGTYFKVSNENIVAALENYKPKNNRSQFIQLNSNQIILDAYNANPTSMEKALINFGEIKKDKKIVILGDMLELGEVSDIEHIKIYQLATKLNFENIFTVGKEFSKIDQINNFNDINTLKESFNWNMYNQTLFLIKGSRGIRLEKLLD